jgi:hypothetical protein
MNIRKNGEEKMTTGGTLGVPRGPPHEILGSQSLPPFSQFKYIAEQYSQGMPPDRTIRPHPAVCHLESHIKERWRYPADVWLGFAHDDSAHNFTATQVHHHQHLIAGRPKLTSGDTYGGRQCLQYGPWPSLSGN